MVVRDMNRDGRQDVVVSHDGRVGIFLQAAGGGLLPETCTECRGGASATYGDGRPDIAAAGGLARGLFVFRQLPQG